MKNNKTSISVWFDDQAEEVSAFYASAFKNVEIKKTTYYQTENPSNKSKGSVLTVEFDIEGTTFTALNGGPIFKINPSISFFVVCETEEETEKLWEKLSENGEVLMPLDKYEWSEKYGWLTDKFGVSWQIYLGEPEKVGQKISPLLFFTGKERGKAEEAVKFYTSVFKTSEIEGILKYSEAEEGPTGLVKHAQFYLEGQTFMAMDTGTNDNYPFSEGVSFVVHCENQAEIDYFWEKFTAEGEESMCGWLKDKFGVSWQIVPKNLAELIKSPTSMKTMMGMKKLDIEQLENA